MQRPLLLPLLLALLAAVPLAAQYQYPFQNPDLVREERITNILSLMTLLEKIAALGTTTAVPRLGIPDAGGSEGLHCLVQRPLGGLGDRAGDEVVQMYVAHLGSKVTRPIKELRGFERISLAPRETKTVRMKLPASSLAYWDQPAGRFVVEQEPIRITVGGSSADARLQTILTVTP